MRHLVRTRTNAIIICSIAILAIALALIPVQAQENDAVEYEFSFRLNDQESATDRQDRLQQEIGTYCENLATDNSGIYADECTAEITTAANAQMNEEATEERYASR